MNVGVASSNPNPNYNYFNSRGMWLTYVIVLFVSHYVILAIPMISVAVAWTATNLLHNIVRSSICTEPACILIKCVLCCLFSQIMFIILHVEKGTPFETTDQGKSRFLTVWEQLCIK